MAAKFVILAVLLAGAAQPAFSGAKKPSSGVTVANMTGLVQRLKANKQFSVQDVVNWLVSAVQCSEQPGAECMCGI